MGILTRLSYMWQQFINHGGNPLVFWRRPTWSVDQIPDHSDKAVLITRGNSGTGYATALALYNAGANVTIACRSLVRAQEAAEDIKKNGDRGTWGVRYIERAPGDESKVGSIHILISIEHATKEYER
ncbi:hypothetical protein B9479_002838 [Cryptococcus floricola]|uniref:Ketoreductase (KR) domain-containing protein n=1 Tax=Cryptococcus floricola TaxID=2591691 RepID=A0A5D3AYM4_9TREE|nr:hypothetical protein B9479_002838 [Cryptococcus floricola]